MQFYFGSDMSLKHINIQWVLREGGVVYWGREGSYFRNRVCLDIV